MIVADVVQGNEQVFPFAGAARRIADHAGAGDGVLALGQNDRQLVVADGDLIIPGFDDLRTGESVPQLLIGKTEQAQHGNGTAEVI